jgi:hypothetical protein
VIDALILTAALYAKPKPIPPTVKRAYCYAFEVEPKLWGDLRPYMREWCR